MSTAVRELRKMIPKHEIYLKTNVVMLQDGHRLNHQSACRESHLSVERAGFLDHCSHSKSAFEIRAIVSLHVSMNHRLIEYKD